ncbi:serine hydroxymethyltransferase [Candidatus Kaiserbacteria bacterium CG10_big_fil_rev_8_21_14_0_10_44_10]|uniref:Serine hydroxymethyltransferase n=1 Tax=Candidatus Kaiserbacteria bacterium CG10_big_fil_rev_8_21_14_0_10_44_10 TaxID=1974606 RepID=A0A2H0UI97_9BACT|nr:MAG: serine hydroxymethyltransferase [Candidatus Kaiserbacteria bacterium CG10_big_fil_rev_8_21_14_0_10_44_10]
MYDYIKKQDEEIFNALEGEERREESGVEMIPSENYVSRAVREANGSVMTNKYSEGYPGKRYYGGQDFTDQVETLAINRAKELFNCQFANVQSLSGAPANVAMYFALMEPGDTVLGMDLSHGGHLTHGHPTTSINKVFNFVRYKMKDPDTGEIDYEELAKVAREHKPKIILAGFSAYSRELDYAKMKAIAEEVGAYTVADMAHIAGLIAGGVARNPFDDGFDVITTTTHKTLRGPRGGMILTRESEEIATKINKAVFPGLQGGPHMNQVAAKAVAFGEALTPAFKEYAAQILKNAKAMEAVFAREGVRMLGGGTSNHLILADVFGSLGVTGKEAETVLDEVGITLNKNMIADETRTAMDPSGIRFGTPAMTTRKMMEGEATRLAEIMIETLRNKDDVAKKQTLRDEVKAMCEKFPVPEVFV